MNRNAHEHDLPDAELVCRAQRGVPTAFAVLVKRYQDRVYNTCYQMCHNHADALDLTQATFLKALEALDRFQGRSGFFTWLFRIAVNQALSLRRSARRRQASSLDSGFERGLRAFHQPAAPASEPARELERGELHDEIAQALQQLDAEFRVAVVLKDIEDLDYATIATILGIPVGTVKSRIHRGRMMLRDLLGGTRRPLDRAE